MLASPGSCLSCEEEPFLLLGVWEKKLGLGVHLLLFREKHGIALRQQHSVNFPGGSPDPTGMVCISLEPAAHESTGTQFVYVYF